MYEFIIGPLMWISFIIFLGGSLLKLGFFLRLARKDRVVYPHMGLNYFLLSFWAWVLNFFRTNFTKRPNLTIVTTIFHICLLVTPVFFYSHVVLWYQTWNIIWWALPDKVADIMTVVVIVICFFFFLRRLFIKEVKCVTSFSDYVFLALVTAPFITGFVTFHQWVAYQPMLILHILSGQILLIVLPFSRLSHMLFIFFTQAYMGSEFTAVQIAKNQK